MIKYPTTDELTLLQGIDQENCISIYAPFIEPNAATNPNRLALKNLLQEAEKKMLLAGMTPKEIKQTLHAATDYINGPDFWPIQHESIALFMHQKFFRSYHIPEPDIPERIVLANKFDLKPLKKALKKNRPYYLLTLDHNHVAIYKGDHYGLQPLESKDFPMNMKEALRIDEFPQWLETHGVAPARMGKGARTFHGQYNVAETDKIMLKQFFRMIDTKLKRLLKASKDPLIIAGVNYLQPIYRSVNTYPHLLKEAVDGNVTKERLDILRDKAWKIINNADTATPQSAQP